jgi:hypothetical protein
MQTRLSLCLTSILFLSAPALAQKPMAVALTLGGSYNLHTGADLQKTGSGVGFVGGAQLDVPLSGSLDLLTGVYAYDNRIGNYTHTLTQGGIDYSLDVTVTVAYAEVEPMLKYTMPDKRFFLVAGPSVGFKVEGQSEVTTTILTSGYSFSNGYSYQTTTNELQDINTRFELHAGAGYVFTIDRQSRLTTQLTFGYGLNNVEKNVDWRINSIRLIAGLEFDIFQ